MLAMTLIPCHSNLLSNATWSTVSNAVLKSVTSTTNVLMWFTDRLISRTFSVKNPNDTLNYFLLNFKKIFFVIKYSDRKGSPPYLCGEPHAFATNSSFITFFVNKKLKHLSFSWWHKSVFFKVPYVFFMVTTQSFL